VNALNSGDTLTDTLTVTTDDGTTHDITVTINGANDAAVIGGNDSGSITEDAVPNTTGDALTISDPDNPATFDVLSDAASDNGYGTFSIDASGNWTYALDNGNTDVDALNDGDTLSDTITVTSSDGTTHVLTVTIDGHTDAGGGGGGGDDDGPTYTPPTVYTGGGDPNDFDGLGGTPNNDATIHGTNGADIITGGPAGQNIDGGGSSGIDIIYGGGGDDTITGGGGNDILYGQTGNDTVSGEGDNDTIYGGSGSDTIVGGGGIDNLYGGSGNDTITGSGAADTIVGGYGADTLTGNTGGVGAADTFVYLDQKDTGDTITDFSHSEGDKIDLQALGATAFVGDLGGDPNAPASLAAHSVGYASSGGITTVYVDTDGVAGADLEIHLSNGAIPVASDFILHP
jgi:VCBS repeat-containing protein